MTKQQYQEKLQAEIAKHKKICTELSVAYAEANNPYGIGAIIYSTWGEAILVDKIRIDYTHSSFKVDIFYAGLLVKKDGTPRKDGKRQSFYLSSVVGVVKL